MSMIGELQRRNVIRVGAAYLALSWLLLQIIDTVGPDFGLPDGSIRVATIVLAIAFLPVLIFTWSFDLTPEGIKRDSEVDRGAPAVQRAAKRLDRVVIVLLVLATGYFAFDKFVLAPEREQAIAEEARDIGRDEGIVGAFGENSIAVLPFDDMSEAGDQEWFADGIAEEILNLLAEVGGLRVTSRTSSFAFRDDDLTIAEIAELLDVRYVLEGSVRKAGDDIRITAQLIEATADGHEWSQNFDRKFDDVFAIQDEIAAAIVDQLQVEILGELPTAAVTSDEAYELYLEALPLLAARGEENLRKAFEIFEQVIDLDPAYAPGLAGYASALFWGDGGNDEVIAAAQRALDIDPRNAEALALLGRIYGYLGKTEQAEAFLKRAIEVNPSHPFAWRWLGTLNSYSDPAAYLHYARRAFSLNPRDPTIQFHTGLALAMLGRYAEAKQQSAALVDSGAADLGIFLAGQADIMVGNLARSLKAQYVTYRNHRRFANVPRVLAWLGEIELAIAWNDAGAANRPPDDPNVVFGEAFMSFYRGDSDRALGVFENAAQRGIFDDWQTGLGKAYVDIGGDSLVARQIFESALTQPGQERREFDRYRWVDFLFYAVTLHRTGETERAEKLFVDVEEVINRQIADGVIAGHNQFRIHEAAAIVHATRGDYDRAIRALNQNMASGGLCAPCLKYESFYQPMQDIAAFQELIADVERRAAEQRQILADEGLLLTPEEVLALETFQYDPFAP